MKWWQYIIIGVAILIVGFLTGYCSRKMPEPQKVIVRDTVTVWKDRPVPVPVTKYIAQYDTIRITDRDTIERHDTTFVVLQRQQKCYKDSTYIAYVSGINPALDSIRVAQKTITITTTETIYKNRLVHFGIGATAGYDPFSKTGAIVIGGTAMVDLIELYNVIRR